MTAIRIRTSIVLAIALVCAGATFAQDEDYHKIADRFFELVQQNKPGEAVDYIFGTNPWLEKVPDQAANVRTQFSGLKALIGEFISEEALIDTEITSRYAYMYYLVAYDRQPIKIEFHFYRPGEKWVLLNFQFNADISADIATFARARAVDEP